MGRPRRHIPVMRSDRPTVRPYAATFTRLRAVGLRPTRQRLALGRLLFEGGNRHFTAEQLHTEARDAGVSVSLATVYNTLHQFRRAELLREVVVEAGCSYFDTNTAPHHHMFYEDDGRLEDFDGDSVALTGLPTPPNGQRVERVDIIIRVRRNG